MKYSTGLTLALFTLLLAGFAGKAVATVSLDLNTSICVVAADDDEKKDGDTTTEDEAEPDCD